MNVYRNDMSVFLETNRSVGTIYEWTDHALLDDCALEAYSHLQYDGFDSIFGDRMPNNRAVAYFSNATNRYITDNGCIFGSPLAGYLLELLNRVNDMFGASYNGILVNYYVNGTNYVAPHVDNVNCIDSVAGSIAVSVGACRFMRIRRICDGIIETEFVVRPYTLLQMGGCFQEEFTHEILPDARVTTGRFSFAFRTTN
jgi:alkylated DNA repair dioxygenase AlkB